VFDIWIGGFINGFELCLIVFFGGGSVKTYVLKAVFLGHFQGLGVNCNRSTVLKISNLLGELVPYVFPAIGRLFAEGSELSKVKEHPIADSPS